MVISKHILAKLKPFEPFEAESKRAFGRSYGLSHAGYDVRLDQNVLLWPKGFSLGSTLERCDVPWDCLARIHDKSTNARLRILVQNSTAEPNWRGHLTLEITNEGWGFVRLRRGTPIAHVVFERIEFPISVRVLRWIWRIAGARLGMTDPAPGYRGGKYDNQKRGPQAAILAGETP